MVKYSTINKLYQAHTIEHESRYERYMQNLRAAFRRSGGYERYKRDSKKYNERHRLMYLRNTGKVLRHINGDLWPAGLIYTVVNGKIVRVRGSECGE